MTNRRKFYSAQERAREAMLHFSELRAQFNHNQPILVDVLSEMIYWMAAFIEGANEQLQCVAIARKRYEEAKRITDRGKVTANTPTSKEEAQKYESS